MRARAPLAFALALAATLAALMAGGAGAAKPTESQTFFRDALLKESRTTAAIKSRLRKGAVFISSQLTFVDLTGDGKEDAIVLVESAGAAGAIAAYVFSTDGAPGADAPLRMVFRSQTLFRAQVRPRNGALLIDTPIYKRGDDICCPDKMQRREYTWSASAKAFARRAVLEYDLQGPA